MSLERLLFSGFDLDLLKDRMKDLSIISSRSAGYSEESMCNIPVFLDHIVKLKFCNLSVSLFSSFI